MPHSTVVEPEVLRAHLGDPNWAVLDCRFDVNDPAWGSRVYSAGHIPGALHAHLERDLAGPASGGNGRHPLPPVEIMAAVFSRWGIDDLIQVVAYDDQGGGYAARVWWMLQHLGHSPAAVLDGGLAAWQRLGYPMSVTEEARPPRTFVPRPRPGNRVTVDEVRSSLGSQAVILIDSRAPERYRGEQEAIDPVAGHIPGALNRHWRVNLSHEDRMRPTEELRREFVELLGGRPPEAAIVYCGSGVTACHNLLAMAHAGLPGARLYPGSWSEWCADTGRPVAVPGHPERLG